MARVVTPAELPTGDWLVRHVECHRQYWRGACTYEGYIDRPRQHSGLVYVVAPTLRAAFTPLCGRPITAGVGDLLYIPQGLCYTVAFSGSEAKTVDMYTVNYDLFDSEGQECLLGREIMRFSPAHPRRLQAEAETLSLACYAVPRSSMRVAAGFFSFLSHAFGDAPGKEPDCDPIRRGLYLLREEWNQNEPIRRYAAACDMSESRFYLLFQRYAGMGPAAYRNQLRLTQARSMLTNSSLPIAEIAAYVGFSDPFYFSRLFHRLYGVSPRQYRHE